MNDIENRMIVKRAFMMPRDEHSELIGFDTWTNDNKKEQANAKVTIAL